VKSFSTTRVVPALRMKWKPSANGQRPGSSESSGGMLARNRVSIEGIPKDAALIIIDVQKGFDESVWGDRNNLNAEENIATLLEAWRRTGRPIFHIKHISRLPNSPLRPGQPGNEIKDKVKPKRREPVITKSVNSAFIGTNLEKRLRKQGLNTIILVGLTTDHCVSTTARMAGNLGFRCYVVADATATFERKGYDGRKYAADEIHQTALASLNEEFAGVVETRDLLKNLS
jgi:nicotinamidase-related amidase